MIKNAARQCFIVLMAMGLAHAPAFADQPKIGPAKIVPAGRNQVNLSFAPLVKQVAPAVVNIYTKRTVTRSTHPFANDPFFQQFFGGAMVPNMGGGLTREQVEGALGSGVIIDGTGIVVTNAHVIRGADEISIVLGDGREFPAKLSLKDDHSDLAILRVDAGGEKLPAARLRSSEDMEVGDMVLAIGNPFGVGQTVTSGIVSALSRSSLNISDYNFFIQTDAAVNPGNSGGPLVAMDGGVVGINTAIYSQSGGSLGIGFAIPSEMVQTVIAAEANGQGGKGGADRGVVRPWLGVTSQPVTREIAESIGLPKAAGTMISGLHRFSPLHKSGVKIGDVIVSMNGKPIKDGAEMKYRMATVPMGSAATIGVFRNGKVFDAKLDAIAPPEEPSRDQTTLTTGIFGGVTVANLNPAVAAEIGNTSQDDSGVVVMKIDGRNGIAGRFLKPGDVVLRMNGVDIKTVADLKKISNKPVTTLDLAVSRNGKIQQFSVR